MTNKTESKEENNEGYEKVEQEISFWNPAETPEIEGILDGEFTGKHGKQRMLKIDTDSYVVVPGHSVLSGILGKIEDGVEVKIVKTGETKSSDGRTYFNYDVFRKK